MVPLPMLVKFLKSSSHNINCLNPLPPIKSLDAIKLYFLKANILTQHYLVLITSFVLVQGVQLFFFIV